MVCREPWFSVINCALTILWGTGRHPRTSRSAHRHTLSDLLAGLHQKQACGISYRLPTSTCGDFHGRKLLGEERHRGPLRGLRGTMRGVTRVTLS